MAILDHNGLPYSGSNGRVYDPQATSFHRNGFADEGYGSFPLPHVATFNAIYSSGSNTYWQDRWDEAIRMARENALVMRRDAFLMSLLQERKLAVASIPWELEIPDEKDERQRVVRDTIKRAIEGIADLRRIIFALLEAVWYGRYAVEVEWEWIRIHGKKVLTIADWFPINGDKLGWNFDGIPYVLTNATVVQPREDVELVNTTAGGRGLLLKGTWRDRFFIHRHEMDDADYFEGQAAGGVWGVGVRSRIFWMDWVRREYMEWITTFLERVGLGVTLWYYDGGNPQALNAVAAAAKNQSRRANLFVPIFSDGKGSPRGLVERIETPVNGVDALRMLKEDIEQKIERYVVGQEASSKGDGASGLGNQASAKFQWNCVPVEGSEILTREGWKSAAEAAVGEEVLAYDASQDRCEWTPMLNKTFHDDADVVRIFNGRGRFEAYCTPNHSWATEKTTYLSGCKDKSKDVVIGRRGGALIASPQRGLTEASSLTGQHNIILAAAERSASSLLTPVESAFLGWLVTDGAIKITGSSVRLGICQSKEQHFDHIERVVRGVSPVFCKVVSHTPSRTFPGGNTSQTKPQHWWYLPAAAGRGLLEKCSFRTRADLPRIVCQLSFEARASMLSAMMAAESDIRFSRFLNTDQHIMDAFEILCALQGIATGPLCIKETTHKPLLRKVMKSNRMARGMYLRQEHALVATVWCPTTKFGTWVMRQNGRVMITGNTKDKITDWDASNLAETLTGNARNPGLVYLIQRWSFPDTMPDQPGGFRVKWKFGVEKQEAEKKLQAAEKVIRLGIPVKTDEVRNAAGFTKPDVGDEVVSMQMAQPGAPGQPGAVGQQQPGQPGVTDPNADNGFEPPFPAGGQQSQEEVMSDEAGGQFMYEREHEHEYSSTQFELDLGNEVAKEAARAIKAMRDFVRDSDLADDGREDCLHITAKYGLATDDPQEIARVISGFGPVRARLRKTSLFSSDKADVLKIDVDSECLHKLNALLSDKIAHTDTFPTYKPHITMAYLKPGRGERYAGMAGVDGYEVEFTKLTFSDRSGFKTTFDLVSRDVHGLAQYERQAAPSNVTQDMLARKHNTAQQPPHEAPPPGWTVYHGARGGIGWKNTLTGKVLYATSGRDPFGRATKGGKPGEQRPGVPIATPAARRRINGMALAKWYADHWNLLAELGLQPEASEKHEAGLELWNTGAGLWFDAQGGKRWHAISVRQPEERGRAEQLRQYAQERAPAGGITIGGQFYPGGEWIPGDVMEKATPAQKQQIEQKQGVSEGSRMARGPVDMEKLRAAIAPHAGMALKGPQLREARATFDSLMQAHGEMLMHRIEELTQGAQKVLATIPPEAPNAQEIRARFTERLASYARMLDWAEEHGMTPEESTEPGEAPPGESSFPPTPEAPASEPASGPSQQAMAPGDDVRQQEEPEFAQEDIDFEESERKRLEAEQGIMSKEDRAARNAKWANRIRELDQELGGIKDSPQIKRLVASHRGDFGKIPALIGALEEMKARKGGASRDEAADIGSAARREAGALTDDLDARLDESDLHSAPDDGADQQPDAGASSKREPEGRTTPRATGIDAEIRGEVKDDVSAMSDDELRATVDKMKLSRTVAKAASGDTPWRQAAEIFVRNERKNRARAEENKRKVDSARRRAVEPQGFGTVAAPRGAVDPSDSESMADLIQEAMVHLPNFVGAKLARGDERRHKVFISDIYDAIKDRVPGLTLEQFKQRLEEMNREGVISASRMDLPELAYDMERVRKSEHIHSAFRGQKHAGATLHLVSYDPKGELRRKPRKDKPTSSGE